MATRKQKHAAAVAKHEAFMKKYREDGLKSLEASKKREEEKSKEIDQRIAEVDRKYKGARALAQLLSATKPEVTVGEFLDASNKMLPVFSDQ